MGIPLTQKGNIEVAVGILVSERKGEVRTLERTGVEMICDSGYGLVSCWNGGRWAAGSLETGVKEHELRGVNWGYLGMK